VLLELEADRPGEDLELAADLGRERGREQPLCDQSAVLVGLGVDRLPVAGQLTERPDVLDGERAASLVGLAGTRAVGITVAVTVTHRAVCGGRAASLLSRSLTGTDRQDRFLGPEDH
jgi:hypothetical protein